MKQKRTKVQMTLTSAQVSTVGEHTKHLAQLYLIFFDVVCQFAALTAAFVSLQPLSGCMAPVQG